MTTDPSSAPKIPAMETPPTPYGAGHVTSLSPAVPREAVHKRQINCNGFVRADGLYDIEAELTDHKTYDFPSDFRGTVTPDLAVHHMVLRITIDRDRVIQHAEAITITGPYAICPTANAVFDNLVGLQIGPGWRQGADGNWRAAWAVHISPNYWARSPPLPIRPCMVKRPAKSVSPARSAIRTNRPAGHNWRIAVLAMPMIRRRDPVTG